MADLHSPRNSRHFKGMGITITQAMLESGSGNGLLQGTGLLAVAAHTSPEFVRWRQELPMQHCKILS